MSRRSALAALVAFAFSSISPSVAAAPAKREVPNYDGRGEEAATAGDVALWVPRVAMAPAYGVSEWLVRRPLGAAVSAAERAKVPQCLYDFFTFGPEHQAGIAPIAFVDFGFDPSVGLFAFWNDAAMKGHDLRLRGSTWGADWLSGAFSERFRFGERSALSLTFSGVRRPDLRYHGTGALTLNSARARYGEDRLDGGAKIELPFWRSSQLSAAVGMRSATFRDGDYDGEMTLSEAVAAGMYARPSGFGRGYTAEYNGLSLAIDTRAPGSSAGSGIRAEVVAEQGTDIRSRPASSWIRYSATAGGFLDVNGRSRVVSLAASAHFADPLGPGEVPFTELVSLGGSGPLRGFLPGRLVGRSGAAVTARYRWPIWAWLDGSIQASAGNVFDSHLSDLDAKKLRLSAAMGVESGTADRSIELLAGLGTETFDQGAHVDSVRIVLGTNHGF